VYVRLCFVDLADPVHAFGEARNIDAQLVDEQAQNPDIDKAFRHVFTGMYLPISPGPYDYGRA
jgi:hypothetical protein